MIMPIIINPEALQGGVSQLRNLQSGSVMGKAYSNLFAISKSETSDAARELYQQLQQTEEAFLILVENTIQALEAAGVSFQQADKDAADTFSVLGGPAIL